MEICGASTRVAALAAVVAVGLIVACTSGPSQSQSHSRQPRTPLASPAARRVTPTGLRQQSERFVHFRSRANPNAVAVLASSRNLQAGQQGAVLTLRAIGSLMGSCRRPGRPALQFRFTYRGAGPPVVTRVSRPLARAAGLYLLGGLPAPSPTGGRQRFVFLQIVAGGEAADFSLALWATLTPQAGGCAFATNGVLRVRCSAYANPICSYIARRPAWAHLG